MSNKRRYAAIFIATVLSSACTTTALSEPEWKTYSGSNEFTAEGRLAVKMNEKGSYANFEWVNQNNVQTINILSPLGNVLGQLCEDRTGAFARDSENRIYSSDSAEELSQDLLGFSLPIQYLKVWAEGYYLPKQPYEIKEGRLYQLGWQIYRLQDTEGRLKNLQIENDKLSMKLVFSDWQKTRDTDAPDLCSIRP